MFVHNFFIVMALVNMSRARAQGEMATVYVGFIFCKPFYDLFAHPTR
jgi:hypothetical protein